MIWASICLSLTLAVIQEDGADCEQAADAAEKKLAR